MFSSRELSYILKASGLSYSYSCSYSYSYSSGCIAPLCKHHIKQSFVREKSKPRYFSETETL